MASTIDIISVEGATNTVVIGEGSVRHYELMSSDYVRLVFSTDKKINIRIGDHITTKEWGTFYITEQQRPTYNKSTGGFDYDLQFKAPYYLWNNRLYKYDPKNKRNEASWSLTDNLENHMAVFLRNLSYYGWTYTVDSASYGLEEAQRTVYISFQNKYLLDGLSQIAEAFNLEYWITDNIIHFGKVESGTAVDFNLGDNVEEMTAENSESDGITRYYAFGSTQNIPSGYRKSDSPVLLNGVVQKRLMLPEGTPYIDIESGLKDDEIVEGIVTFDDVYPRTKSSVSEVIKVPKTVEKSNTVEATTEASAKTSDSDSETEVVNIYRFKTTDFNFSADYILANTDLQVQFVSGKLNGMTFDVAFNPNGASETTVVDGKTVANPDAQLFELVRNDTYGLMLPNDTLCPAAGDKFILLGWDASKLTAWQELITKAEEELKSQLETYVKKKQIDPLTYVCTMMSDYMYGLDANGNQDPNYSKVGSFPIGQTIRLHSDVYFKTGVRNSRVIGYEYKLDVPFDSAQIYVGESPIYSNSKATQDAINEVESTVINYRGGSYSNNGTGSGNLFVIRSTDAVTAPSDTNVYSSKRSDLDFAHKRKDDRISALWTFSHGKGARRGVQSQDYDNNAVNEDNLFGHGFELVEKPNSQGKTVSRLEIDELLVRTKAFFASLEVRKITYVGGNYLFSDAGSKVYYVEWLLSDGTVLDKATHTVDEAYTFRCYMYSDDGTTATMNGFDVDDQVMCRTFNIDSGVHTNVGNKYWWRRCTGVGKGVIAGSGDDKEYQYVDISNADCLENSDYPEAEDVIVQFGNWSNKARQGAIYLMVYGDLAPAILEWENVGADGRHFVLPDPTIQISPKGNIFYGEFHSVAEKSTGGGGSSIDDQINALIDQLNDIKNQADKKFEIWFGSGEPHPNSSSDTENNQPASDWTTDAEKALHAQDLYYDTDKSPASKGGRAWRWMAHNSDSAVSYYWDEVTDKDTIDALEKAADLQNQVDDIVSDGVISRGSEKSSLLVEWNTACSNYNKYKEQATDYDMLKDSGFTTFETAFLNVCKMLNNGAAYTYPNIPAWIDKTGITVDTVLSSTPYKTAENYRATWNAYYEALAVLLAAITKKAKELADKAQSTADTAIGRITDIVSDGVIDPSEKQTLKRDFLSLLHEMYDDNGLEDKGKNDNGNWYNSDVQSAFNDLVTAFKAVGTYLNGGAEWNVPSTDADSTLPSWIKDANMGAYQRDIDGDKFVSLWTAMYSKRGIYLTILSKTAKDAADNAQQTADDAQTVANKKAQTFVSDSTDAPKPPYKAGDFWIQTDKNNNVMVCKTGRNSGNYVAGDWADLSDIYGNTPDVRTILATLADKVWTLVGESYLEKISNSYIDVYIGSQPTSSVYDSDISYYNGVLYVRKDSSWTKIENSGYENTFVTVMAMLGTIKIRVFNYSTPPSPKLYDLALTQISIQDPVDGQVTKGNYEIMMYNEKGVWEVLRSCTLAIMKSYGDHIVNLVAGSEQSLGNRIDNLSGTYVTQDSFNAFSQSIKFDAHGNITNFQKSGLLTTADGNLLYALSQGNSVNMLMGSSTGTGWTKEASSDASYFSFNEATRQFDLVNYYPAFRSGYSGASYSTLKSPIVRIEKNKKYILSFNMDINSKVQFSVCVRFGTASECSSGARYFTWANNIEPDDGSNKKEGVIYRSKADSSRYFVIIETNTISYEYMQVLFINWVSNYETSTSTQRDDSVTINRAWPYSSTEPQTLSSNTTISNGDTVKTTVATYAYYTGSSTQYVTQKVTTTERVTSVSMSVSKIQMELAIRDTIADIEPSSYKESQNAIESYIKQTVDSIELSADKIKFIGTTIINNKFWVGTDGNVHMNDAQINGLFISKNTTTWNEIELNAKEGYLRMYGPDTVDDQNRLLPGEGAKKVELFSLDFATDPDSLMRYVVAEFCGPRVHILIDPLDGLMIGNTFISWDQIVEKYKS